MLVTEKKNRSFPGLDVQCAQVQTGEKRLTWSECLGRALDQVETPLVLYMQEDYFLESPVRHELVQEFASCLNSRPEIACLGLTHFGAHGPYQATDDPRLKRVGQRANYRVCTQAGFWRKEALERALDPEENGWMFELFGTRRSWHREETYLTVDPERYRPSTGMEKPIFHYTHTGIIKGRWHPAMPALFQAHGIPMDFSRRGFFVPKPKWQERIVTFRRLIERPDLLWRGIRGK
jgi:hypothetical protein